MKKKLVLLSAALLAAGTMAAQTVVKGRVLDQSGNPVAGASVKANGKVVALTDNDGNFSISKLPAGVKRVSIGYVGMNVQTVDVSSNMNVTLTEANTDLDEVMVVAYGTTKKSAFTGSAAVINSEGLSKAQTSDVSKTLEGKVAGVTISNTSGTPGAPTTIRVRGIGSIFASNAPLIIVDGAPYSGDLNTINPADIASFSILKDAASAALYGARGANGVVVITTKSAKVGKTNVAVDAKWGSNSRGVPEYDVITDAGEYYETMYRSLFNQSYFGSAKGNATAAAAAAAGNLYDALGYNAYNVPNDKIVLPGTDHPYLGKLNPAALLKYQDAGWNDWRGALFNPALRQEYNVNLSRGNEKERIYFSFGYLDDNGYNINTYFKRYTTRLKYEAQVYKWLHFSNNVQYTNTKRNTIQELSNYSNTFNWTRNIPAIYPIYKHNADGSVQLDPYTGKRVYDDGTINTDSKGNVINDARAYGSNMNPLVTQKEDLRENTVDILTNNSAVTLTLPYDFEVSSNLTYGKEWADITHFQSPLLGDAKSFGGRVRKQRGSTTTINFNQILRWSHEFENGLDLNAMVGHESYSMDDGVLLGEKTGFLTYQNPELWQGTKNTELTSEKQNYRLEGYFSQLTANYKNRYYASASFRRDASSVFHPKHRWGSFWSFGASWRVSEEDFYAPFKHYLSNLKLKASYGQQGNDYLLLANGYRNWQPYQNVYNVTSNGSALSLTPQYMGNENVTWETNHNFNVGLEFAVLSNIISGEVEFFTRKTTDMLFNLPVPSSTGFSSKPTNIGDMRNTGVEFTLNAKIFDRPDFSWNVNVNATHFKNEIIRLPDEYKKDGLINGEQRFVEGRSIYEYHMVKTAGVDPETGMALYWLKDKKEDTEYKRQEYDATKAGFSRQFVGSTLPDLQGGFGTDLSYKGFDLSLQFAYSLGGKIVDYQYANLMSPDNNDHNWHRDILKSWSLVNKSETFLPRLEYNNQDLNQSIERFLTNASYLSFRNVTLGYNLPQSVMDRWGISGIRVYAMVDNVALLSKRKGFDPRYSISGSNRNSTYSAIRTISFGLNVKF